MTQAIHIPCPKVGVNGPGRKAVVSILGNVYSVDSFEVQMHHGQYFADGYPATPLFHSKRYYENGSSAFGRGCYLMTFVTDGQFRAHEDDTTTSVVALHEDGARLFHIQVTYDKELPDVISNLPSYKGAWSKVGIVHFPDLSADKVKEKAGLLLKELLDTYLRNEDDSFHKTALGKTLEIGETQHSDSNFVTKHITPLRNWLQQDNKVKVKRERHIVLPAAIKAETIKTTQSIELEQDNDILEVYDKKTPTSGPSATMSPQDFKALRQTDTLETKPDDEERTRELISKHNKKVTPTSGPSATMSPQDFKALRQTDTLETKPDDEERTRELISKHNKKVLFNKNSSKGNHCLYRAVALVFGMKKQKHIDNLLKAVEQYLLHHSSHFAYHEGIPKDVYEAHVRGFRQHGYGDGDVLIALQAIFRANIMLYQRGKYVSPHSSDNRTLDNTIDLMYANNHYEAVESIEGMSKRSTDLRNKEAKVRSLCTL